MSALPPRHDWRRRAWRRGLAFGFASVVAACTACQNRPTSLTLRAGYTSSADIGDVPSLMALHALEAESGYRIQTTFFAQPELAVDALASGDIDVASGGVRAFWAAVAKGADLVMLMAHSENGYVLAATPDIQGCGELHGRTLASSSRGSLPAALADAFLQSCPDSHPQLLAMPHSGDRLSALVAHAVDAAVIQRADLVRLLAQAPGEFHTLDTFAGAQADLVLEGVFTTRTFLRAHRDTLLDYVRERVRANRLALDQPAALVTEAARWPAIGTLDPAVIASELAAPAWARDGGLTPERARRTLDFFVRTGSLPSIVTVEPFVDVSVLTEAREDLAEAGLDPFGPPREDR